MRRVASLALSSLAILVVAGCAPESPAEKAAKLRARYQVEVTGLVVREEPLALPAEPPAEPPAATEPAGTGGDAAAPAADPAGDAAAVAPPPVPVRQTVLLDLLVRHDAPEKLARLTVDLAQIAADGTTEKARFRRTLDVAAIEKGTGNQVTVTLEDIDYAAGDGFTVEVRPVVPPGEQAEYPELGGG
jgi:hypothetical protein